MAPSDFSSVQNRRPQESQPMLIIDFWGWIGGGVTVIPADEGGRQRLSGPGSYVPELLGVGVKGIRSW